MPSKALSLGPPRSVVMQARSERRLHTSVELGPEDKEKSTPGHASGQDPAAEELHAASARLGEAPGTGCLVRR